jgi:hypothetical protein
VNYTVIALVPIVLLPIVLLLGFAGCVGEDAVLQARQEAAAEQKKADDAAAATKAADDKSKADAAAAAAAAQVEARRYENQVGNTPDLVSYWRLGEPANAADTVAKDSAKVGPRDGTYNNLAGIHRGQPGVLSLGTEPADKSAEFTGTQGYVEISYDALRNPPYDFTIELWLKPTDTTSSWQVVYGSYEVSGVSSGPDGSVVRGVVLDVIPAAPPIPGAPLQIRLRVGDGAAATTLMASLGDGLQTGGWRHVVATYAFNSKILSLYVNADGGQPAATSATAPAPITFVENKTAPTRIGAGLAAQQGPGVPAGGFFTGQIDEVALYRVPLAGADIKKHFLAAINPTP